MENCPPLLPLPQQRDTSFNSTSDCILDAPADRANLVDDDDDDDDDEDWILSPIWRSCIKSVNKWCVHNIQQLDYEE